MATATAKRKLLAAESSIRWLVDRTPGLGAQGQHDLRNALALVVAFSSLLDIDSDTELLADVDRALERARELTCSVLASAARDQSAIVAF